MRDDPAVLLPGAMCIFCIGVGTWRPTAADTILSSVFALAGLVGMGKGVRLMLRERRERDQLRRGFDVTITPVSNEPST